jgi:hypothetical protein
VDIDTGMPPPIARQEPGEKRLHGLRRRADSKHAALAALEGFRPLAERIGSGQQLARSPQQVLAFDREMDATTDSVEELHAQLGLECANLTRQRGLAQVEAGAGAGEAAGVHDRHEGAQVSEVHVRCTACIDYTKRNALDT